jgi:hypothetical protein
MLRADGFEKAEIGVSVGLDVHRIIYDYDRCIQILIDRDEMSQTDAIEYMQFNVVHAWVGDDTPMFIETMESAEIDQYADSMIGP